MRILFILRNSAHLFYTESVFNEFLARGHHLTVLYERYSGEENDARLASFSEKFSNFNYGRAYWRSDVWKAPLYYSRALLSYRRYLFMKDQSLHYRDRYRKFLPPLIRLALGVKVLENLSHGIIKTKIANRFLRWMDDLAGLDERIFDQVKTVRPDVLVICIGGLRYGSVDVDYLKAAKLLCIPTAAMVLTWDSMSSKSLVQFPPDILLVLNELQAKEAVIQHEIDPSKIKIVGAAVFDRWFGDLKTSLTRREFCVKYGLHSEDPILLYLGSPMSNTADETWVLKELRAVLAKSEDTRLRKTQIVLRPHPDNAKYYSDINFKDAVVIPKGGDWPGTKDSLQMFYDTLAHSAAAFGINTSAMIEAALAERPVLTLMLDKYKKTQADAMHFKNMLLGGALASHASMDLLLKELKDILEAKDFRIEARKSFVSRYIRPLGMDRSAASHIADAMERLHKTNIYAQKTA